MIIKLLNAWKSEDYLELLSCFSPERDTVFTDYCPAMIGQPSTHLIGSYGIEMFFRNHFYPMNHTLTISQEKILDEKTANFFACYAGRYVFARLSIEETDSDGLIKKAVIRPE